MNMKKLLLFLINFIPIIGMADTVNIDGINYNLITKGNVAEVARNSFNTLSKIIIPEKVSYNGDEYTVIKINENAFGTSKMESVEIPNTVTTIGWQAFHSCYNLKSVKIGSGVSVIGGSIFLHCSLLSSIVISKDNPYYDSRDDCNAIIKTETNELLFASNNTIIPNSVTSISFEAFQNLETITTLEIPNSVESIGRWGVSYCTSLKKVIIGDGMKTIGQQAFENNTNLTYVSIGKGISEIGWGAFGHCVNIEDIYIYANKIPDTNEGAFYESHIEYSTLHVPSSLIDNYKNSEPWKNFKEIVKISMPEHTLTYMVDGNVYKIITIEEGENIIPEPTPTKEGYTFSGWSEIPQTMPDHDVTVTGTFTINKYKLIYMVDGTEYKSYDIEYGASITPEPEPAKEGYTFSGWSDIPSMMPAQDVTVTGTFTVNKYKLTYMVDNEVYRSYDVEYGATITPEEAPTKENYIFSGWSDIPQTMPAHDVTVTGSFTYAPPRAYTLTYMVDGEVYKTESYYEGDAITPEAEPTKEGYTFSGWSYIPSIMPAEDVTVYGTFTVNKYTLTYMVDGEVYKTYEIEYGTRITPEDEPTKEGYTFSGWSNISETMPAQDVTVIGSFTINTYILTYIVDGEEYKSYELDYGTSITPEAEPTKEGYTFSGWGEIPETMPAYDVTVTGTFAINKYKITYIIDGVAYLTEEVEYGSWITPPNPGDHEGYDFAWEDYPDTMPAHDITINGTYTATGIEAILASEPDVKIFTVSGKPLNKLQKGVNILRYKDGRTRKIVMR